MSVRGKGKAIDWIRGHVGYSGDDCLLWPFSRTRGYGTFGYLGEHLYVHRYMCELANGPPPTPEHEATHSCGRGHLGCATPKHLFWKTPGENLQEAYEHGSLAYRRKTRFLLTSAKVKKIRPLKGTESAARVALRFGVSESTISDIWSGRTWKTDTPTYGGFQADPWTAERRAQYGK
jgi:hypothetical protein